MDWVPKIVRCWELSRIYPIFQALYVLSKCTILSKCAIITNTTLFVGTRCPWTRGILVVSDGQFSFFFFATNWHIITRRAIASRKSWIGWLKACFNDFKRTCEYCTCRTADTEMLHNSYLAYILLYLNKLNPLYFKLHSYHYS